MEIIRDKKGRIVKPVPQRTNKNGLAGRPETITPEIESVLLEAFAIGCQDNEAMMYAEEKLSTKDHPVHIASSVFYNYQIKHPEFVEKKERFKKKPTLKARNSVIKGLDDPKIALEYLQLKEGEEFNKTSKVDNTNITLPITKDDEKAIRRYLKRRNSK